MTEDVLSVTKGESEETEVKDGLKEGKNSELTELHFESRKIFEKTRRV